MKKKKQILSSILCMAMLLMLLRTSFVFAEGETKTITLPQSVENGTFVVKKGNTVLSNGDSISIGDTLTFDATPNNRYIQISGTVNGEKTIEASDFFVDETSNVTANGWTALSESDENDKTNGFEIMIPRSDAVGTKKTITFTSNKTGEQTIRFEWYVNHGYSYDSYKMDFIHNGTVVKTQNMDKPDGYNEMCTEDYTYTATGDDTFEWVYTKTAKGTWADSGRTCYFGNLSVACDTYTPEPPVYIPGYIVSTNNILNGSIEVDKTFTYAGDTVKITPTAQSGYYCSSITVEDLNGNPIELTKNSFTMPESDVTVSAVFAPIVNNFEIATKEDMLNFINIANDYPMQSATLTADINMDNEAIKPICPSNVLISDGKTEITQLGYMGTFDGAGHKISNFTVTPNETEVTAGLFGTVSGTVKNLVIDGANYNKGENFDGRFSVLCGQLLTGGVIEDCVVANSVVKSTGGIAGAVAGCNYGGIIRNSVSYNNTVTSHSRIGNLVGDNQNDSGNLIGTVLNCYSDMSVIGTFAGTSSNCAGSVSGARKIAYLLNTQNGTAANSGIWSVSPYPVKANSGNNPVYKVDMYWDNTLLDTYYGKAGEQLEIIDDGYTTFAFDGTPISKNSDNKYVITTPAEDSKQISVTYTVYNITYNTNNGTINSGNVTSYIKTKGATLPTDVSNGDLVFMGWYENADFSGNAITQITAEDTGDKEYYAKWGTLHEYLTASFAAITDRVECLTAVSGDWFGTTVNSVAAIQSKNIGNGQSTKFILTATVPTGKEYKFSFDYFVSSEKNYDKLYVTVNNGSSNIGGFASVSGINISGSHSVLLPEGTYTITFEYKKDNSNKAGNDLARISNIVFAEKYDFIIKNAVLNKKSGMIDVTVERKNPTTANVAVILSAYENGALTKTQKLDITSEETGRFIKSFDNTDGQYKIFIWNMENFMPLALSFDSTNSNDASTEEYDFIIKNAVLNQESGMIDATVERKNPTTANAAVILSAYENDVLTKTQKLDITSGETGEFIKSFDNADGQYKIFIWNMENSMPLALNFDSIK